VDLREMNRKRAACQAAMNTPDDARARGAENRSESESLPDDVQSNSVDRKTEVAIRVVYTG
jgi:hypothetical protein